MWLTEKQQRRARRECAGVVVGSRCLVVVLRRVSVAREPLSRRTWTFCRYRSYSYERWLSVLLRMLGMIDGNRKRKKERESKKEKGKKKEDKKVDVDEGRLGEDVSLFIPPIIHMDNFLMTL